jgi:hypothetical protein
MLIPERKAELVAALRSGKYKQGRGYLKSQNGFCCLGVACDLYGKGDGWKHYGNDNGFAFEGMISALPDTVKDYFGFSGGFGDEVNIGPEKTVLSFHNDDGRTFAEIADAIEQQL